MNPANHPIRLAKLFVLACLTFSVIVSLIPSDSHAQIQTNPKTRIATCENTTFGVKYSKTREANCRLLWEFFSYQTLPTNN